MKDVKPNVCYVGIFHVLYVPVCLLFRYAYVMYLSLQIQTIVRAVKR